jgi:hypothetical protein
MKSQAKKRPHRNEQPLSKQKTRTTSKNSQPGFVAGVGALLLRPVLRLTLRVLEWQALRAARLEREAERLRKVPKGRLRFERPRLTKRDRYLKADLSPEAEHELDVAINQLQGEAKRDKTNANKKLRSAKGNAQNRRSRP